MWNPWDNPRRRQLLLIVTLITWLGIWLAAPAPASAAGPCDLPLVRDACDTAGDLGGKATGVLTDPLGTLKDGAGGVAGRIGKEVREAVGGAIESAAGGVLDQLTSWVGEAAGWLFLKVVAIINSTTSPNLFKPAYLAKYRQILALASVLAIGVVCLAVIEGGRRGDAGSLVGVMLAGLPLAILGTALSLALIQISLHVVDALSLGVANATATDVRGWFKAGSAWMIESAVQPSAPTDVLDPGEAKPPGGPAVPGFVLLITSLLAILGALGLWIELLMRDAAIYVCALFLPLGLAASVWPRWGGVARRTVEILVVLVISKFFIVMIISLAASFLGKPDSVESALAGSAMLIVALLMPFMLLRVIPMMEGSQLTRGAAGASRTGTQMATQAQMLHHHLASSRGRKALGYAAGAASGGATGMVGQARVAAGQTGGPEGGTKTGTAAGGAVGLGGVGGGSGGERAGAGAMHGRPARPPTTSPGGGQTGGGGSPRQSPVAASAGGERSSPAPASTGQPRPNKPSQSEDAAAGHHTEPRVSDGGPPAGSPARTASPAANRASSNARARAAGSAPVDPPPPVAQPERPARPKPPRPSRGK